MSMIFSFGDIWISCDFRGIPLWMDEMAESFLIHPKGESTLSYTTAELPAELLTDYTQLYSATGYELLQGKRGIFHLNRWASLRRAFGFFAEELGTLTTVYYHPQLQGLQPLSVSYLLSVLGLHHKLLDGDALLLHASYLEVQGSGILFLGPSGVGKSTQARLWEEQGYGQILNGDRVLLRKREGRWFAHGYPCCGSSRISVNKSLPLRAIVLLEQGEKNLIQDLRDAQKLLALSSGAQFYSWASEEVQKVFSLGEALAGAVPMIKLCCTPEQEAVSCLQNYLSTL